MPARRGTRLSRDVAIQRIVNGDSELGDFQRDHLRISLRTDGFASRRTDGSRDGIGRWAISGDSCNSTPVVLRWPEPFQLHRGTACPALSAPHPDFASSQGREVAERLAEYNLLSVAVCDEQRRLLGAITVDDVLDRVLPAGWRQRRRHVVKPT